MFAYTVFSVLVYMKATLYYAIQRIQLMYAKMKLCVESTNVLFTIE